MKKDSRFSRTLKQRESNKIQRESHLILPGPKTGNFLFHNKVILAYVVLLFKNIEHVKTWVSKLFMAKGHTSYCGPVRGSHVDKLQ